MTTLEIEGGADARPPFDNYTPAAEALQVRFGLSKSHSYALIADGEIATVRLGKKILVAESELTRFRESLKRYTSTSSKKVA